MRKILVSQEKDLLFILLILTKITLRKSCQIQRKTAKELTDYRLVKMAEGARQKACALKVEADREVIFVQAGKYKFTIFQSSLIGY